MKPVRKAIFPVGGLGTRFLPATKAMPKEMLPVVDKPLIEYAVEEAKAAGIDTFIFVTARGKTVLEDHFDVAYELRETLHKRGRHGEDDGMMMTPGSLSYVRQQEPLGMGHAVWCARHFIQDEPFAVILPDDLIQAKTPCLAQMVAAYEGGNMVATMEVPKEDTDKYGILTVESQRGALIKAGGVVEKPISDEAPSQMAVIGRYILDPKIMTVLGKTKEGAGGEIQLTDALAQMIGEVPFNGYLFEGTRFDCGTKEGLLLANVAYGLRRPDIGPKVRDKIEYYLSQKD